MQVNEIRGEPPTLLTYDGFRERSGRMAAQRVVGSDMLMKELISVIIPAHNEEEYLRQTLVALQQQTYPFFEVIVVSNGCDDNTAAVARDACDKLVVLPDKGLCRARNVGAAKARGDLLVFLDADTLLEDGALSLIARSFSREASCGTLHGRPDVSRFIYRGIYFLKNFLHRFNLHYGSSGIIVCWRSRFKEAGGFDETLHMRENHDLMCRLRRFGQYQYISGASAITSMRRYEKGGAYKISWLWVKIWFQSLFSDLRHRKYEAIR
jgi:glycosyltransferase involved in cell wall biosynthesis